MAKRNRHNNKKSAGEKQRYENKRSIGAAFGYDDAKMVTAMAELSYGDGLRVTNSGRALPFRPHWRELRMIEYRAALRITRPGVGHA